MEAKLRQSQNSLAQAQTRFQQQLSGVIMVHARVVVEPRQAEASLNSANERLNQLHPTAPFQLAAAGAAIRKAEATDGSAEADLVRR